MLPRNGPETASSFIKSLQDAQLLFSGQYIVFHGSRSDLVTNNKKRATQSLAKDKTKSRNEAARGRNMKLKSEDEKFTVPVVVYCTARSIDDRSIDRTVQ
jgi:hypothetical protein